MSSRPSLHEQGSYLELSPDGQRIVIPARRNARSFVFALGLLAIWGFAGVRFVTRLKDPGTPVGELVWAAIATFAAVAALHEVSWQLFGREWVSVRARKLRVQRAVLGIIWTRYFDTDEIHNLEVDPVSLPNVAARYRKSLLFWGSAGGSIRFDYGGETHRFGLYLDEAEADLVVHSLEQLGHPVGGEDAGGAGARWISLGRGRRHLARRRRAR